MRARTVRVLQIGFIIAFLVWLSLERRAEARKSQVEILDRPPTPIDPATP